MQPKSLPLNLGLVATAASLCAMILGLMLSGGSDRDQLMALQARFQALSPPPASKARDHMIDLGVLTQAPIFVMTSGTGAYKERAIVVSGIAVSPGRHAALISIENGPAHWLSVGDHDGDLRLDSVGMSGVVFDTPIGPRSQPITSGGNASSASSSPTSGPSLAPQGQATGG